MVNMGMRQVSEYEIDAKDKKIIQALFENARFSIADIAKKTGIRRDSIIYRLKKLQEKDVILGFQPMINPPALGFPNVAIVLLRSQLKKMSEKNEFIRKVKQKPEIVHMTVLMGKYDYYLAIIYKDQNQLFKLLEEINLIMPGYIIDYEMLQIVEEPKYEDMLGVVLSK